MDLKYRQTKIQEKRKNTPWRKFLMEIVPRQPLVFSKIEGKVSRYPETERTPELVSPEEFQDRMETNTIQEDYTTRIGSEGFFEVLYDLWKTIPMPYMWQGRGSENVTYADVAFMAKNCYLSTLVAFGADTVLYSFSAGGSVSDIHNSVGVASNSSVVYASAGVTNSMQVFYSRWIDSCHAIRFSSNLIGCTECIRCTDLVNASYCIDNISYPKNEYIEKKRETLQQKAMYEQWYEICMVVGKNLGSHGCEGSYIVNSIDVINSQYVYGVKGGRNNLFVGETKGYTLENSYDNALSGNQASDIYGCHGVCPGFQLYCSMNSGGNTSNLYYSYFMIDCSYCFGCIALKNKSYCIFNKQYEKDEWFDKVNEIFALMEKKGIVGEFFPGWMNPFYFNDTLSLLVESSFTKEEVEIAGCLWRDEVVKVDIPEGIDIVKSSELGEYENGTGDDWAISPDILKKVIQDEVWNVYRIIPMEYKFLKKYGLPLPRKHWLARLKQHFIID